MNLTTNQIAAATGATLPVAQQWAGALTAAAYLYGIDTPQRQAAWLSQLGVESAGLTALRESMNYSDAALLAMWPDRFTSEQAAAYGRTAAHPANQPMIANIAYANRFGNGDVDSGDGWRYRGGGLIQLTFRDNYRRMGAEIGQPLETQPDLITQPTVAALTAAAFWRDLNLNALADAGDIAGITRKINGGSNGLARRQQLYAQALPAFLG